MSSNEQYLTLLENLKASNVASNSSVLDHYSNQIEKELELIQGTSENINVLKKCKEIIKGTDEVKTAVRIDKYVEFGKMFKLICLELRGDEDNVEHLKKIAVHYLNIVKTTRDETIKAIALEIADGLSKQYDQ
jgi:hypothetical protein